MSVNWYWKSKRGEIIMRENETKQTYKIGLYGGNMMFAMIYRYRKLNEQTGKQEKWYNFLLWFDDCKHLRKVLKDDKDFFNHLISQPTTVRKFKININSKNKYANKEMLECAKILAENGYKVELY